MSSEAMYYLILTALLSDVLLQASSETAADQLLNWSKEQISRQSERATNFNGCPVPSLTAPLSVGKRSGPLLLMDSNLLEDIGRFNRERIPERPVHAKGAGALGYFVVTHDITRYTRANLFSKIGKNTSVVVRFSTTTGESGSSDLVQDARGFAIKFKTFDGNLDLLGINLPNFPIRDPILFPSLMRSRKRNPRTNLEDHNMRWDFDSQRPETTFNNLFRHSSLGRPDGYRYMDGYSINTFKFINAAGKLTYCKFHYKTNQGLRNLTTEQMHKINGHNLDYATEDLYNAIGTGNYPSWTLYVQIMSVAESKIYKWNPFDATKVWLEKDFPLIPVGKIVLNSNLMDYFTQMDGVGFDPQLLVPGIEVGPDKLLQGRSFAYQDSQRQRLGATPFIINHPRDGVQVLNYHRDGRGSTIGNGGGGPNYFPNSFDSIYVDPNAKESVYHLNEDAVRHDGWSDDNFSQAAYYWENIFTPTDRQEIAISIASTLKTTYKHIQKRALENFSKVSPALTRMIRIAMRK